MSNPLTENLESDKSSPHTLLKLFTSSLSEHGLKTQKKQMPASF